MYRVETATNRYESGISENNLRHWGILEAVKELLQNNVYAKTILGDQTSITHDGKYAIISNSPSGFTKGKLLIGESEQANVEGAPGQYGEGMKVAMAVARRLGKEILVSTNGFLIRPELEPSSLDETVKALTYYIEDIESHSGTTFRIECDLETLQQAMLSFAILTGISEESTKATTIISEVLDEQGDIAEMDGGYLYVNGVLVYQTPAIFSYNFTDPGLMNRDRTSVDMTKVKSSVIDILRTLEDTHKIKLTLEGVLRDGDLLESQTALYSVNYPSTWKQVFSEMCPGKVAIATGTDADTKARYHRFKVLTDVPSAWKYFFTGVLGIPYTTDLEEVADKPKMLHKKPSGDEATTLGWCKMLITKYYSKCGPIRVSDKVTDEFGNDCLGLYSRKDDTIWLRRDILSSKEQTFKTLLHEMIHRETGASDNTAEFTKGFEEACWKILMRGKE